MWKRLDEEMPPMRMHVLLYGENSIYADDRQAVGYWDLVGGKPYWNVACVSGYEWDFDMTPSHWQMLPTAPL